MIPSRCHEGGGGGGGGQAEINVLVEIKYLLGDWGEFSEKIPTVFCFEMGRERLSDKMDDVAVRSSRHWAPNGASFNVLSFFSIFSILTFFNISVRIGKINKKYFSLRLPWPQ